MMSAVLVDSNVLIDLMTEDAKWFDRSAELFAQTADRARLVINPIIYAEISVKVAEIEELDAIFPKAMIEREALPYEAAFLAGKAFLAYRRRGGAKRSPLPDFFIGAHAAISGYELLTRDAARYRGYFPTVRLIVP